MRALRRLLPILLLAGCAAPLVLPDAGAPEDARAWPPLDTAPLDAPVDARSTDDAETDAAEGDAHVPARRTRIAGTITALAMTGDTLDAIAGARIAVEGGPGAVSDELGRYAIDVPPGSYRVSVDGPRAEDGIDVERLAPATALVVVIEDETTLVDLTLGRGCVLSFSGRRGGALVEDACGPGGAVRFEVPPRAFVDAAGAVVDGPVRLEVAVMDRARPLSLLALPALDDAPAATISAIDVHARDALSSELLRIAPGITIATHFEIPSDTEASPDATFESIEDGADAWAPVPGAIVTEGARRLARVDAAHFSGYRVVQPLSGAACIDIGARVCPPGGSCAARDGVTYRLVSTGGVVQRGNASECATVGGTAGREVTYVLSLSWSSDVLTGLWAEPLYVGYATGSLTLGSALSPCASACTSVAVDLHGVPMGCLSGTLAADCGPGCSEPIFGRVTATVEGARVATVYVLAMCGGDACITVPAYPSEVVLEDEVGHRLVVPGGIPSGGTCLPVSGPRPACDEAASGCASITGAVATCADADCLDARFTASLEPLTVGCPTGTTFVRLDATATRGRAQIFEWYASSVDDTGARALVDYRYVSGSALADLCLPPGENVITLVVSPRTRSIQWSRFEQSITVGAGTCGGLGVFPIEGTWDVSERCDPSAVSPSCGLANPSGDYTVTMTPEGPSVDVVDGRGPFFEGRFCGEVLEWGGSYGAAFTVRHGWYQGAGRIVTNAYYAEGTRCSWSCSGTATRR
jgi:hypothetical protein